MIGVFVGLVWYGLIAAAASPSSARLAEIVRRYAAWQAPSLWCGLMALAAHGVALTGPIQLALSTPAFTLPARVRRLPLTEFALALMFILYAEFYGSIRTFALKRDDAVQPNRDLLALGAANIVSGLFHGTPVGAGPALQQTRLPGADAFRRSVRGGDRLVVVAAVLAVTIFRRVGRVAGGDRGQPRHPPEVAGKSRLSVLGRVGAHDYVGLERFANAVTEPACWCCGPRSRCSSPTPGLCWRRCASGCSPHRTSDSWF